MNCNIILRSTEEAVRGHQQVRDKHETNNDPQRHTVVISGYTGILTNDYGVNFKYRNLT